MGQNWALGTRKNGLKQNKKRSQQDNRIVDLIWDSDTLQHYVVCGPGPEISM